MDTLMSPRRLNRSDDESEEAKKVEENLSPRNNWKEKYVTESKTAAPKQSSVKILYPTAKYLEVNSTKKISSFDLLVHPPKRQRLLTPPDSKDGVPTKNLFKQKVYYENETRGNPSNTQTSGNPALNELHRLKPPPLQFNRPGSRQTSTKTPTRTIKEDDLLNWKTLSRIYREKNPVSLGSKLQEQRHEAPRPTWPEPESRPPAPAIRPITAIAQSKPEPESRPPAPAMRPITAIAQPKPEPKPLTKSHEVDDDECYSFPCPNNYIFYLNYSNDDSRSLSRELKFHTINERDENKNYFTKNLVPLPSLGKNSTAYSHDISSRKFKKPVYRLRKYMTAEERNTLLKMKFNYRSDPNDVPIIPPPDKRRKLNNSNKPYKEKKTPKKSSQIMYQICNELTRESQIIATGDSDNENENDNEKKPVADEKVPITKKGKVHFGSEKREIPNEFPETPHLNQDSFFYFPELTKLGQQQQQRPTTANCLLIEDGFNINENIGNCTPLTILHSKFDNRRNQMHSEPIASEESYQDPFLLFKHNSSPDFNNNNISDKTPIPESHPPTTEEAFHPHCSPFTIIFQESSLGMPDESSIGFFPFMNFAEERSTVTIEDVTDKCRSNTGGMENFETIYPITNPATESTSTCNLINFRLSDYENEEKFDGNGNIKKEYKKPPTTIKQPNPQLTLSSSVHSLSQANRNHKDTTLDQFLEKRRKSDYFVGKLAGLSKSIMKLYKKSVNITKCAMDVDGNVCIISDNNIHPTSSSESHHSFLKVAEVKDTNKMPNKKFPERREKNEKKNFTVSESDSLDTVRGALSARVRSSSTASMKKAFETTFQRTSNHNRNSKANLRLVASATEVPRKDKEFSHNDEESGSFQVTVYSTSGNNNSPPSQSQSSNPSHPSNRGSQRSTSSDRFPNEAQIVNEYKKFLAKVPPPKVSSTEKGDPKVLPSPGFLKRFIRFFRRSKHKGGKTDARSRPSLTSSDGTRSGSGDGTNDWSQETVEVERTHSDPIPRVSRTRTIAQHTDSREFYRAKRIKFFKELREFQEDSLKVYLETMTGGTTTKNMSFNSSQGSSKSSNINPLLQQMKDLSQGKGKSTKEPKIKKCYNDDKKNNNNNSPPSPTHPMRKAISSSVLCIGEARPMNYLLPSLLPLPPVLDMLMKRNNNNTEEGSSYSNFSSNRSRSDDRSDYDDSVDYFNNDQAKDKHSNRSKEGPKKGILKPLYKNQRINK